MLSFFAHEPIHDAVRRSRNNFKGSRIISSDIMATNITFEEVCRFIKEDDPSLIDNVDLILGFLLIIAPFTTGLSAAAIPPALGLLGVKNELTKIGKALFEKLTDKKDKNNLHKLRRMEVAYGLLCFTAFFEALDTILPDIRKHYDLKNADTFRISDAALRRLQRSTQPSKKLEILDYKVSLPHPADDFINQRNLLNELYAELTNTFAVFLHRSTYWKDIHPDKKVRIDETLAELPTVCLNYFDAQYFVLASKYEDFFVWSNLQEYRGLRREVSQLSQYLQRYISECEPDHVDVGLENMSELIAIQSGRSATKSDKRIIQELERLYKHEIEKSIIVASNTESRPLQYPQKSHIFIPQAFRVVKYDGQSISDEQTWDYQPKRDDLGAFLVSYLSSPYSFHNPLIILGHPGSGKSLLTEVLSAKLLPTSYSPVRIVMREILTTSDITSQIEQQLRKDLGRSVTWVDFCDQIGEQPALLIFDGYDELLQTTGEVISDFVLKLQAFQEREKAIRNPVRAIITSRITLIGKASLPLNSTVLRLEEFDFKKQIRWISVWNRYNKSYFKQSNMRPFMLPESNHKVMELAQHPLLLLMLAVFDSYKNMLWQYKEIDRTQLYSELLHRFIERERSKDEAFQRLDARTRTAEIEKDIARLGVAAIGMFNRKRLHLRTDELTRDLQIFDLATDTKMKGHSLAPAEQLVGSFFFVFESRALRLTKNDEYILESVLEFLHNTFGEFLTAHFILNQLFDILTVPENRQRVALQTNSESELKWYCGLMYTPLHTRPLVLNMIREWYSHELKRNKISHEEFQTKFDDIVHNHITDLVSSHLLSQTLIAHHKIDLAVPLIGLIATYSLNLVVLKLTLESSGFLFDEQKYNSPGATRGWDRLTSLWRAWMPLASMVSLSSVMSAKRVKDKIRLTPRPETSFELTARWAEDIRKMNEAVADESLEQLFDALRQTGHFTWK